MGLVNRGSGGDCAMKLLTSLAVMAALSLPAMAEPITFKEARKALPRATAKASVTFDAAILPESDQTRVGGEAAVEKLLRTLGASTPAYGAVAISPSEGLFVEWLNGAGNFHSIADARAAALAYCNGQRKGGSAKCALLVEVTPKGTSEEDTFSLSGPANKALRGPYRKLKSPKAFAISAKTGNFGFDRGDGGRALEACAAAGDGAKDCKIVVAD